MRNFCAKCIVTGFKAVQTVGTRGRHDELWVPAEELAEFNAQIMGKIEVMAAFYGEGFAGVEAFEATL